MSRKCELLTFNIKLCSSVCNAQHQEENKYQAITNGCQVKNFNNILNRITSQNPHSTQLQRLLPLPFWLLDSRGTPGILHPLLPSPSCLWFHPGSSRQLRGNLYDRGEQTCSVKGLTEKVLDFAGYRVPVTIIQFFFFFFWSFIFIFFTYFYYNVKADIDNT